MSCAEHYSGDMPQQKVVSEPPKWRCIQCLIAWIVLLGVLAAITTNYLLYLTCSIMPGMGPSAVSIHITKSHICSCGCNTILYTLPQQAVLHIRFRFLRAMPPSIPSLFQFKRAPLTPHGTHLHHLHRSRMEHKFLIFRAVKDDMNGRGQSNATSS